MVNTRSYEILQLTKQIPFSVLEASSALRAVKGSRPTGDEIIAFWAECTWSLAEALYDKYTAEEQKELGSSPTPVATRPLSGDRLPPSPPPMRRGDGGHEALK